MHSKPITKFIRYGLCSGLLLFTAVLAQAQINVTFQVNMAVAYTNNQFLPASSGGTDYVEARGSFMNAPGWTAGFTLTNDPSASNPFLFSGTYLDTNAVATAEEYKFIVDNGTGTLGWESPASTGGNNRLFTLGSTGTVSGTNETLATVYFNDNSVLNITNNVTFQVNMAVQVQNGNFVPGSDYVEARGSFNGWNGGFTLTNDPSAANPSLYTGTAPAVAPPGGAVYYKYIVDGGNGVLGWETPTSTGGGNRQFALASTPQSVPEVYFNDAGPGSSLSQNTVVTFSVNMTNAVGTDAYTFSPSIDEVYINGVTTSDSSGFWTWVSSATLGAGFGPGEFLMTNNPVGSQVYSLQLTVPAGTTFTVDYKYGINGADDEAGFAVNHVRYIRANGNFVMPMDTFGNQLVEQPFGDLKIASPSGGAALVTWTGLPNVHLQTSGNPGAGWTDHPETAGLSSTNWPVGSGSLFFRLIEPN